MRRNVQAGGGWSGHKSGEQAVSCRASEQAGRVRLYGFGSGEKGFPLQSPPLLEKHRPDACVMEEMGRKGIELKAMIWIWRGAAGCRVWKSATFSGAFSTFLEYSQVLPSMP